MPQGTLLIIDDEERLRSLLARLFQLEDYAVFTAPDAQMGLSLLQKHPVDVVLCDVRLPDNNGLNLIPKIKTIQPDTEIIMITAFGTIPDGVKAIKHGAFDYITKGDQEEQIIPTVARAMKRVRTRKKLNQPTGEQFTFDQIIARSPVMQEAVSLAKRVAETNATVLLLGETGTGKEVFAQAIHTGSTRSGNPFVAVNCSALGHELLESELFGYRKGAFTGADRDKRGLFEEADGGTIFLDEIGEIPLDLQAKLLRALETKRFIKAGDTKETFVDVRIIAATNRNLKKEAESGSFRSDLYYRLQTFTIELPSLKERTDDIPELVRFFVADLSDKLGKPVDNITTGFMDVLKDFSYPGNIRELRNLIERAIILAAGPELTPDLLPTGAGTSGSVSEQDLESVERDHIIRILKFTGGNKTRAADILDIGLATLYRKIQKYGISDQ
ncbi:MAG TPA: sigma-54 dependent transcriptional regulator [Balneolales bacterium]|nr:sigma-54 dependent transcriptional regulator [Balneolales bacterium]